MCHNNLAQAWQEDTYTVVERDSYILSNQQWTDCTFIVQKQGSQQIFKCHRLYLAKTSSVFAFMLYGKVNNKTDEYHVKDVHPAVFTLLLKYIYEGLVLLDSFDIACGLLEAAKKYQMPKPLQRQCREYLQSQLSDVRNVWTVLEFADQSNEPDLRKGAIEIIQQRANEVMDLPDFLDISFVTLHLVVQLDSLNIETEIELYKACMKWARHQQDHQSQSLRHLLDPILPHLRLLTLSNEQFWQCTDIDVLLTDNEISRLLKCINIKSSEPPEGFCGITSTRNPKQNVAVFDNKIEENFFEVIHTSSVLPTSQNWSSHQFCTFALADVTLICLLPILGVVIPSQERPPGVTDVYYEECLTIDVYSKNERKIIKRTKYTNVERYGSYIDVKFLAPITNQTRNNTLQFRVTFHKKGRYPYKNESITYNKLLQRKFKNEDSRQACLQSFKYFRYVVFSA